MRIFKPSYSRPIPKGAKLLKGKVKYRTPEGLREAKLTRSGNKMLASTKLWHINFKDNLGISRKLKGFTDRKATQYLADRLTDLLNISANNAPLTGELQGWLEHLPKRITEELIRLKLLDKAKTSAGRPLLELVGEFQKHLEGKEKTKKYIKDTTSQIKRIFNECDFSYYSEITAAKVNNYLKARRDSGLSYRSSNAELKAVKMFCKWMVESGYATNSPLQYLKTLNTELDKKHIRRAATPDELKKLLNAAKAGPKWHTISGHERYLVYKLAVEAGLRRNEIRTLTRSAFDFNGHSTVKVESGYSKHRQEDVLPLRANLAAELKRYTEGLEPQGKVFHITDKAHVMLKFDLKRADIPYKDGSGHVLDFHALRHTFITNLRNVPSRTAQALARHKSSAMTDKYTHISLYDERAALETLPDLGKEAQEQQAKKTGTDGIAIKDNEYLLLKSCFHNGQHRTISDSIDNSTPDNASKTPFLADKQGIELILNQPVAGSNPASPITQTPSVGDRIKRFENISVQNRTSANPPQGCFLNEKTSFAG